MEHYNALNVDFWKEKSQRLIDGLYSEELRAKAHSLRRPLVTLSYAQSLDGMIAGPNKKAVAISSEPSLIMTHYIRHCNNGILVGIGTILNDNPRLTARYPYSSTDSKQPTPVVLDSDLRIPLDSNILAKGRKPIVVCLKLKSQESIAKKEKLEATGAQVFECAGRSGNVFTL